MNQRIKQREATRERIIAAAIATFSDHGFGAAGTRDIANLAGVNQGLLTYHFSNKESLWREAANRIFGDLSAQLTTVAQRFLKADEETLLREIVKGYVRYAADHPELLRFMIEEGKRPDARMEWLVDTHLKPMYQRFLGATKLDNRSGPHFFYILIGAGSMMFAIAPECERVTGMKPMTRRAVERHAEIVAELLATRLFPVQK